MNLYNSLSRQVEEIKPLSPPTVTVYTCGPTVYDYAHIGHWFNYIRMDSLIRCLKLAGYEPKWVLNITDVGHLTSDADEGEDKLEKGARREGKTAWQIADFYIADFIKGMKLLGITKPDYMPRATDHIKEQIALIKKLEAKGFTYQISDGVYYDTARFKSYSELAKLDLGELQAGARVAVNPEKRQAQDFALWKFSPDGKQRDMEWDSPWGKGFPGWHIECSAMALKYLGPTIDIHSGGIDHLPVHHSNEIAQSEVANGQKLANYWLHANHVLIDQEKISKSLGNTIRLPDVLKQGVSAAAFRLHVLESHYRKQSHFSSVALDASDQRLSHWLQVSDLRHQLVADDESSEQLELASLLQVALRNIKASLLNDLNTAQALAIIETALTEVETRLLSRASLGAFNDLLELINQVLGIELTRDDIDDATKQLLQQREAARQSSYFQAADKIRAQLAAKRIGLRDTKDGPVWFHEPPLESAGQK